MNSSVLPTASALEEHFQRTYGDVDRHGWRVRLRRRFDYFEPDVFYEALVDQLVTPQTRWIDVGGGKTIFPNNQPLAEQLARRCALLVGVDPSDNIQSNTLVHQRVQCPIEEYERPQEFDLVTMRMVAEHVARPESVVASLHGLLRPGGLTVIYTPNRWAPVSIGAALIPFRFHAAFVRYLWDVTPEDAFPTVYKMNTRRDLKTMFEQGGFREAAFTSLDNCNTFQRFRVCCFAELTLWRMLRAAGIRYPENNLMGVYERV